MIDYLEQFFLEEEPRREEGTLTASGAAFSEGTAGNVALSVPAEPESPEVSTNPSRTVEVFQNTTVQNFEYTLANPARRAAGFPISRPAVERAGEGLERRLRRDSRRYDSGFYWY